MLHLLFFLSLSNMALGGQFQHQGELKQFSSGTFDLRAWQLLCLMVELMRRRTVKSFTDAFVILIVVRNFNLGGWSHIPDIVLLRS